MRTSSGGVKFIAGFEDPDKSLRVLVEGIQIAEDAVTILVDVPLTQNEFDALVSFTYSLDLGYQTLSGSTLLKLLNAKNYDAIPAEIQKCKVQPGLAHRRAAEALLFQTNPVS